MVKIIIPYDKKTGKEFNESKTAMQVDFSTMPKDKRKAVIWGIENGLKCVIDYIGNGEVAFYFRQDDIKKKFEGDTTDV